MLTFQLGEAAASIIVLLLPRRFSDRIYTNFSEYQVYELRTGKLKTKPRMTFIEAVFATILFDLALFGTSNIFINTIIRLFTSLQNSWDKPFKSKQEAVHLITQFCNKLRIQQSPWIWEKEIEDYTSINDFFSRTYQLSTFPKIGHAPLVSPASCTVTMYNNNANLSNLLIKGCNYRLEDIGLPEKDIDLYRANPILIGYLSPSDYHRVHAPISGVCSHCKMEGLDRRSASVKFFSGKFNILNSNKRLVIVIDSGNVKIALVIIGGIGVDTIHLLGDIEVGKKITKCEQLSAFRAGGSAIAMFSTAPLLFTSDFARASNSCQYVELEVGESIANFKK